MTSRAAPTLTPLYATTGALTGVRAAGCWRVQQISQPGVLPQLEKSLKSVEKKKVSELVWDLHPIEGLDYIGAQLLWAAWGRKLPDGIELTDGQASMFARLAQIPATTFRSTLPTSKPLVSRLGKLVLDFFDHLMGFIALVGQFMFDLMRLVRQPLQGPWKEISANIYHAGFRALGVTALVGSLIGVVFSYLSVQQLRSFGVDALVVNILGLSIIRELGPVLAAILVAGRSGSAITAQLGVMRVTEELDAMRVMGIPHGFRLVLPKVLALAVAMPLLVVWTDIMALAGGIISAKYSMGLAPEYFLHTLPSAVPVANYWIGLFKSVIFGILIAFVACHFGLRILPDTESLARGTTTSVVTAITVVIMADALFALVFDGVGF